jgi:arylsulfatase
LPTSPASRLRARRLPVASLCATLAALLVSGCVREARGPALLLLITADTLRADRIGAFGSELGLTPHIDALADESVVFAAAYAAAPFTLPSVSALMTGKYPEEVGIFRNESVLPESVPTLAGELRRRGWKTRAVVSNFVLRDSSGISSGFEVFDDEFPQVETVRKWPERIATDTTDAALEQLADCAPGPDARCFLWVHYQDPHGPYTPPEPLREAELARERTLPDAARQLPLSADHTGLGALPTYQFLEDRRDIGFYRAGYHAEIRYLDDEIGRLLAGIDERGLGDRTLVAFTADHGEGLGENDYWFAHGEYLDDAQVHVPLLFRIPGRAADRRDDVASLTDVFPTLLAAVSDTPSEPAPRGRDLLSENARSEQSRPYFASLGGSHRPRHGMIDGEYRLVVTRREDLWDARLTLREGNTDLTAAAPQIAKPLRQRLNRLRTRLARSREEIRQELTDEERQALEALGYVDEAAPR